MREAEFKAWLEARGNAAKAIATRIARAKRAERSLRGLGIFAHDLDEAFDQDRLGTTFVALKAQLSAWKVDGRRPLESLVPQAPDPTGQLTKMIASIRNYRDFRLAEPVRLSSWPQLETLRARFIDRVPDFENFAQPDSLYAEGERRYKDEILGAAAAIIACDEDDEAVGRSLYKALMPKDGPFLRWQTADTIAKTHPDLAPAFYATLAVGASLSSRMYGRSPRSSRRRLRHGWRASKHEQSTEYRRRHH